MENASGPGGGREAGREEGTVGGSYRDPSAEQTRLVAHMGLQSPLVELPAANGAAKGGQEGPGVQSGSGGDRLGRAVPAPPDRVWGKDRAPHPAPGPSAAQCSHQRASVCGHS